MYCEKERISHSTNTRYPITFTRISVKRSIYADIQKRVIKCWNKKRALILEY
nr:MAG TPA: hypothetical protein [Caudoviricetes sp.]